MADRRTFELSDGHGRSVEAIGKVLAAIAIVLAGLWTILQYTRHVSELRNANNIEAWKPYRAERVKVYTEASELTGQILVADDPKVAEKATEQLRILYKGKGSLFAQGTVLKEWTALDTCVSTKPHCSELPGLAFQFVAVCRGALNKEWDLDGFGEEKEQTKFAVFSGR
jgi:hypothetical protein